MAVVRERDEAIKEKSERFDVADFKARGHKPRNVGVRKGKEMGSPQDLP